MSLPSASTARRTFVAGAAVLAGYNVGRALLHLGAFEPAAVAALVVAVLVLARWGGVTAAELGLARGTWWRGVRDGLIVTAIVVAVLAVTAAVPATRGALDDSRADLTGGELLVRIFGGILLLTVIPEELAFRGLLLATGSRGWSARVGLIASSVLFGLWHVLPTWNDSGRSTALHASGDSRVLVVAGTVVVTAFAGAGFAWLRRRSGSLIAPVLGHLAVNAAALVAAWLVRG